MAALWEDRGHAAKIRAAAKAADMKCSIVHGLGLEVWAGNTQMLTASFSGKGAIHKATIRTRTKPDWIFRETEYTPAEAARAVVAWFAAGCPEQFDVLDVLMKGWLK